MASRTGVHERRRSARDAPGSEPGRRRLVSRILGSYFEMPGLLLDIQEASRLFGVSLTTSRVVLQDLVTMGRLRRSGQHYILAR